MTMLSQFLFGLEFTKQITQLLYEMENRIRLNKLLYMSKAKEKRI